jgi:beta-1,4-mannooligosaccharide/beta-1,4-mannosyl-N-acetylglucosamine phosphorylase
MPWEDKQRLYRCDVEIQRQSRPGLESDTKAARIYNSAVLPYKNEFVGIFEAIRKTGGRPCFGQGKDGLKWKIGPDPIEWVDETGKPNPISYGYDPRFVKLDDTYYVTWCDDMHGASIGLQTNLRISRPFTACPIR